MERVHQIKNAERCRDISQQSLGVLRVDSQLVRVATCRHVPSIHVSPQRNVDATYETMSFNFFNGRIFTTLRAGLALKVVSSFVKGLMPLRSLVAGLCCTTILQRPGIAKVFEPLRPTAFLICSLSESNTLPMS